MLNDNFEEIDQIENNHSFQEIDQINSFEEDCDIEVCEDNFVDIDHVIEEPNMSFMFWFPELSLQVLNGLYSSKESKKNAVEHLMKLFEFDQVIVPPLQLLAKDTYSLYNLYKQKLSYHENMYVELKNFWCDILNDCSSKCKQLTYEKEQSIKKLNAKASELHAKNKQKYGYKLKEILINEYQKTLKQIVNEHTMYIRLLKSNYSKDFTSNLNSEVEKINNSISTLENKLLAQNKENKNIITKIRNSYNRELINIEYYLSRLIAQECEQFWLEGLK